MEEKIAEKKVNVVTSGEVSWYNLYRPKISDIKWLKEKFPSLHQLDLETCLAVKTQRPKVDFYSDYIFFVIHLPFWENEEAQVQIAELNIFLGKNFIVTLYHQRFRRLKKTFSEGLKSEKKTKNLLANGPEILLFHLIKREISAIFSFLDKISMKMEKINRQLFSETEKNLVMQIFQLKRDIIILKTSITPQIEIFQQMETRSNQKQGNTGVYWGILADNLRRISDRIENNKDLINGLSSTFESFLSYRTNEIIKVLTIFSVILLPLTFITGAYGMNLAKLPLSSHPLSFWILLSGMLVLVFSMIFFFKKKRWI